MYLTIDLGSTHFKAAIWDSAQALVSSAKTGLDYVCDKGGVIELSPNVVENALRTCVAQALAHPGVDAQAITAVALTSQAQTFALADADGHIKANFISWQDTRANETATAMSQDPIFQDFAQHSSFGTILGALMVAQVRHKQQTDEGLPNDAQLVPLPTYLFSLLTGTRALDHNLAAMSGLYSLPHATWHAPYLSACGIIESQLPPLVRTAHIAGHTTAENPFGLSSGVPVLFAGNDQTAGAFGAKVEEDGGVLITLGTAQVAYCTDTSIPQPADGLIRGPYPNGMWYRLVADGVGGGIVTWVVNMLGIDYDTFFKRVGEGQPGCRGVVFDPDLPAGKGSWSGIGMDATQADIARAVVEGLSRRLHTLLDHLGIAWQERPLFVAGGGSARPEWLEILAAELKAEVTPVTADPLLGAARMAAALVR